MLCVAGQLQLRQYNLSQRGQNGLKIRAHLGRNFDLLHVIQTVHKGLMLGARFTFRRFIGDHDITEQPGYSTSAPWLAGGKRQHIGRRVLAAPVAVERPDGRVVGEHDSNLAHER